MRFDLFQLASKAVDLASVVSHLLDGVTLVGGGLHVVTVIVFQDF